MNSKSQKIIIKIEETNYMNWKLFLKRQFNQLNSNNIEIDCRNLELSCKDLLDLIEIANDYNCKIAGFCSTSSKTIVSSHSLGYKSNFIVENNSNNIFKVNQKDVNLSKTHFHQGTVRSGEYLDSQGNLLILGDVNPGAIVSAAENIIIWGRLLGIAHAGSKGNCQATISALQFRPVQIRIANKVARGPKEKPQLGLAEQARIDSEKIVISPIEST